MKLPILLSLTLFFSTYLSAQSVNNLVIFSQEGERFQLVIDGERVNQDFQTNVKVRQLIQPSAMVKILFEDNKVPELDKRIFFDPELPMERVFVLKRNRKGLMKMRLSSQVPIQQAPPVRNNQFVFDWGAPQTPTTPADYPSTTETRVTTTTVQESPGVGVTIRDGNGGTVSADIRVNGGRSTGVVQQTTTTTTTTSSGQTRPPVNAGTGGCPAMSTANFNAAFQSISRADFDDNRLQTAKQIANSNCLTAAQIARISQSFEFDDNRLSFAKFAYNSCLDPQNYYLLNDSFEYDSNIRALQNYIQQP